MTLGQYYQTDSRIHRLDPRVKLGGTLLYMLTLVISRSFMALCVATVVLTVVILLSKVPFSFLAKGIRPLLFILILSAMLNIFTTPGHVLVQVGILRITEEGMIRAAFFCIRLILIILGSAIMTCTTTPARLADGMEKSLGFLQIVHVPVHEIAMMMTIALRFIPILTTELDKIMKAQTARGMDFEEGSLPVRLKKLIPILIPLFVAAFSRASELAMAMEARCYHGGKGRTKLHPLRYGKADVIAWICILLYTAGMFAIRIVV